MGKVILVDCSMIFVPTVKVVNRLRMDNAKSGKNGFVSPPTLMYFNSLMTSLAKIGVDKDDIIIMTGEGHAWRKDYYAPYKGQRAGLRSKDTFVNWKEEFQRFNQLHDQLKEATDWHFIRVADGLEADDIIAISCRYFKDKQCVIVTGDKDIFQLAYYPNVVMYNLNKKVKGSKGVYEEVKNPLKIISDKARLGDAGDNIIPGKNDDEEDAKLRYFIVNLLNLPDEIEKKGIDAIEASLAEKKEIDISKLPKWKGAEEKFLRIYTKDKVITPEYCFNLLKKRENKKLKEKAEKKELAKLEKAKNKEIKKRSKEK